VQDMHAVPLRMLDGWCHMLWLLQYCCNTVGPLLLQVARSAASDLLTSDSGNQLVQTNFF
jgi:hypothetical protein